MDGAYNEELDPRHGVELARQKLEGKFPEYFVFSIGKQSNTKLFKNTVGIT